MEKVICDICGTSYPENRENCPVCGCPKDFLLEDPQSDISVDLPMEETDAVPAPRKKKKEVFDFDEVNQEKPARRHLDEDDFDDDEDDEEYDEEPSPNVFLVVILVIAIVLLLLATGFFFFRYFLPSMEQETIPTDPVVTTLSAETEATTSPTVSGIPCTDIVIPGGKIELGKGGLWLMNVQVYPADTTDSVTYASSDETIATVSADGTVTAVAEGTTTIVVTCGEKKISCNVTVDYSMDAETTPDGDVPAMEVEGADSTEATDAAEETQATEATETTETTEATEATSDPGAELKLKQTDISIFARYTSVQLELDCDVRPEDVYWFTMDSTIAICHDGLVTSTGSGMTRIYGEYEGQQVECIVRCVF